MPELFRLIDETFSKVDQEWQWTYSIEFVFIFNQQAINYLTITDHPWRKKGRENLTKELVLNILNKELNGKKAKPTNYQGKKSFYS